MMSATLRNVWPTAAAMLGLLALAAGVAWILTARKAAAENQSPWPQPVALPDADASAIKEGSASDPSAPSMCPLPDLNAAAEESPAMPTAHNEASTSPVRATVPSKPGQVQSATFALG